MLHQAVFSAKLKLRNRMKAVFPGEVSMLQSAAKGCVMSAALALTTVVTGTGDA